MDTRLIPGDQLSTRQLRRAVLDLAKSRGPEKTFCPSEVARQLAPAAWRPLMPAVRAAGLALVAERQLRLFQRGREVDSAIARGPIRFSAPRRKS
jgi:hypothetical protein